MPDDGWAPDQQRTASRCAASGARRRRLAALLRAHQIGKPLEQIMRVARAGRGLRVILHREYRLAVELNAATGAGEQRDLRLGRPGRQRWPRTRETVAPRPAF